MKINISEELKTEIEEVFNWDKDNIESIRKAVEGNSGDEIRYWMDKSWDLLEENIHQELDFSKLEEHNSNINRLKAVGRVFDKINTLVSLELDNLTPLNGIMSIVS